MLPCHISIVTIVPNVCLYNQTTIGCSRRHVASDIWRSRVLTNAFALTINVTLWRQMRRLTDAPLWHWQWQSRLSCDVTRHVGQDGSLSAPRLASSHNLVQEYIYEINLYKNFGSNIYKCTDNFLQRRTNFFTATKLSKGPRRRAESADERRVFIAIQF